MKQVLTLFSVLALTAPLSATAAQIEFAGEEQSRCSIELSHTTRVGADFFEIAHDDDQQTLRFALNRSAEVTINGQAMSLNAAQQRQMTVYHTGLLQSGRDLTQIAIDAVDIAMEGVGIALTALAGADHPDSLEFRSAAEDLRNTTRGKLHPQDGVYILGESWDDEIGTSIEQTIERELEPRIEKIALESAGNLTWHALKAVFTGGASIERDAEAAAEAAEELVEARALQLESRAENLCHNLAVMDTIETDLQSATPALESFDLISLK